MKQQWETQQSPKIVKKQFRRYVRTPQHEGQAEIQYNQLYSANPILPPGVHNNDTYQSLMLKYKFIMDKQKLNKTSFPEVRTRNWLNQTQGNISTNKTINNQTILEQIQRQQDEYGKFRQIIMNKLIVYSRINNKMCNKLDKQQQRFYCSMFINYKKQQIKSKKTPIYQYLQKLYKQMKPVHVMDDLLTFNSAFQSGNLFCALKCTLETFPTYQLFMNNDLNTKGCTQWFYFSIKAHRRIKFKIRIMNFYKPTSLFMDGMKILVSTDQLQWRRVGTSIKYKRVPFAETRQNFYLQFIYQIQQYQKQHYFSFGYPYTYTQLENALGNLFQTPIYSKIAIKSIFCQSFLGNNVFMLTISNHLKARVQKPIIYIIARQHPGQTPGSFIVENLIKTVLHNRVQMEQLRQNFMIKIVPMVNVDGVINGNYRSNFSGNDVNRQWLQPSRKLHPQIFNLKQQILANKKFVHFFLDIHAHSRKMNSFFYGSKGFGNQNKFYPFVCSKLNKHINYSQCSFVDDPSKKTTARVVLQNQANIRRSITFEASFYGYQQKNKKTKNHFKQQDLKTLGQSLALGLYYSEIAICKYTEKSKNQKSQIGQIKRQQIQNARNSVSCHLGNEKKKQKTKQIQSKIQKNCEKIMEKWKKQVQKTKNQDQDQISQGSSIDPQHFQLTQLQQLHIPSIRQNKVYFKQQKKQNQSNPEQKNQKINQLPKQPQVYEGKLQKLNEVENEKQQYRQVFILQKNTQVQQNENKNTKLSFFPLQSNLKNSLMVKKLQSELQMQKSHRRYQSNHEKKQKQQMEEKKNIFGNEIIRGQRFKSIDIQTKGPTNYRNNIIQIKKALKYFMENKSYDVKSTDYDDYKNYLKYASHGATLMLSDKQSVARIKKKYARL